jgi:hypothetical protein
MNGSVAWKKELPKHMISSCGVIIITFGVEEISLLNYKSPSCCGRIIIPGVQEVVLQKYGRSSGDMSKIRGKCKILLPKSKRSFSYNKTK